MGLRLGQMLQMPDVALRRALRLSAGPLGFDSAGLFSAAYVSDEPQGLSGATATLTQSHNRIQVINPGADRVIKLPGDGIRAGESVAVINRSSSDEMLIYSSGFNLIDTIDLGYIHLTALINDPSAAADWHVTEVYEEYTHTSLINTLFAADPSMDIRLRRHNKTVTFGTTLTATDTKSTTSVPVMITAIPARFRATRIMRVSACILNNNVYESGWIRLPTTGLWAWDRTGLGTWTAVANARLLAVTGAYILG